MCKYANEIYLAWMPIVLWVLTVLLIQIHPAVHIKDLVEYVRETNPNVGTQIRRLISETQHRIRNTYKKKKEIEEISKK